MDTKTEDLADTAEQTYYRKSDVRYGAHCPGIIELTFKDGKHYIALTGVMVNLSVTGCLFSNDKMPWANMDSEKSLDSIFDVVHETCRVYIPWINTHSTGKIRRLGSFIIGVEFQKPLDEKLVKSVASLEPNRERRFKPRLPAKYNRILPIARR
ncbi:hypothetical protein PZ897_04085 [Hoeflea sp. YIM 152468]|uniref:hypothetical protein n=1 Tax=Hoeflea sp. YIM 152468 TaxID=3031759 RepID=UPI0023D9D44D|nr:hypothetical protein [Hoeflea sp. YIM 152468]MDF1607352.1 hypothetical protein [Hoeflea sp. YIM 152468]